VLPVFTETRAERPEQEEEDNQEEKLSSDEEDEEDEFKDCQDRLFALYEKNLSRSKDKFKGFLKDVVVTVKGTEYVFKGVSLELNY